MKTTNIRPGLLVGLSTALRGGVSYQKATIEPDHVDGDGSSIAKWETTRVIDDPEEYKRGGAARSRARAIICATCCNSTFGLLCPESRQADLDAAILTAQGVAAEFNATAKTTRLEVNVIAGRIAQDDVQAAQAIGAEVRDLLAAMEAGIKAADPERVREAATRARSVAGMLSAETEAKVSAAIAEVRRIAREIVRVQKAGEQAADVVDKAKLEAVESARFAVLDMVSGAAEIEAAPLAGRAIDFEPDAHFQNSGALSAAPSNLDL